MKIKKNTEIDSIKTRQKTIKVPVIENIHQRVYEEVLTRLNGNGRWYKCGTAYGRASIVVNMSGYYGKKLEDMFGTCCAALLIYNYSGFYPVSLPEFFKKPDQAVIEVKRLADLERGAFY